MKRHPRLSSLALVTLALAAVPAVISASCSATHPNNFNTGGSAAVGTGTNVGGGASTSTGFNFDAGHGGSSGTGGDPVTCGEAATNKTYIGCDFWPTVVANSVWSIFDYAVVVANAGNAPASVTVTRKGATLSTVSVPPNGLQTIYLPWVSDLKGGDGSECGSVVTLTNSVSSKGGAYHLVSSVPVTVYQFNAIEYQGQGGPPGKNWGQCPGSMPCATNLDPITFQPAPIGCFSFTNDASLLLPSTAMTGNYRITSQADWLDVPEGAYFAITGTQDNTSVTVYVAPGGHVVGGGNLPDTPGGGMLTFSLNAGDVAELVSDGMSDITGSLVKATAPVQVISGMPCAFQPFDINVPACDHLEESVFPAETLGKHYFVTPPTAPNGDVVGQIVRIVGNVDGTKISYPSGNQPAGAPTSLNAGQVVDLGQVPGSFEITGDHEFAVVTFMLGGSIQDPNTMPPDQLGDPSQSNATAVEQYRVKYIFLAPTDYTRSYVDIVEPMGAMVSLDNQPVSIAPTAIGSGYGIARVPLGPGNNGAHVLTSSAPVGIQVIGFGAYTSYQYPGGLNLGAIAPPPPPPPH